LAFNLDLIFFPFYFSFFYLYLFFYYIVDTSVVVLCRVERACDWPTVVVSNNMHSHEHLLIYFLLC